MTKQITSFVESAHLIVKGDVVIDRQWPEFGRGLVTVKTRTRITVLFSSGAKRYMLASHPPLDVVSTSAQQSEKLREAVKHI